MKVKERKDFDNLYNETYHRCDRLVTAILENIIKPSGKTSHYTIEGFSPETYERHLVVLAVIDLANALNYSLPIIELKGSIFDFLRFKWENRKSPIKFVRKAPKDSTPILTNILNENWNGFTEADFSITYFLYYNQIWYVDWLERRWSK